MDEGQSHGSTALYQSMRGQAEQMDDVVGQFWFEEGAESAQTLQPAKAGLMDLADDEVPEGAQVFMCGPLPFMQATRKALLDKGVSGERVHYEVFGPDLWAQNADNAENAE